MIAMIIYDSKSGYTERMAKAIAEGASSIFSVQVKIKKIGEPFPVSEILDSDLVFFGSPVIYAGITDELRILLLNFKRYVEDKKIMMSNKHAAVFGSHGWGDDWVIDDLLKLMVENAGFNLYKNALIEQMSELEFRPEHSIPRCRDFGKEVIESIKKSI